MICNWWLNALFILLLFFCFHTHGTYILSYHLNRCKQLCDITLKIHLCRKYTDLSQIWLPDPVNSLVYLSRIFICWREATTCRSSWRLLRKKRRTLLLSFLVSLSELVYGESSLLFTSSPERKKNLRYGGDNLSESRFSGEERNC